MLQIIEGQVEYLGRNDYRVKYTTVGDTQYFVTKELPNGKYIVAKQLIDAILKDAISNGAFLNKDENGQDREIPVPTSFGVIDENGAEIIPCQYKSVKDIGTEYFAVEPVEAVNDSVKERASLFREDPNNNVFSATNNSVKEKIYSKMNGTFTDFTFMDQCSEATVCDAQGNNVINGEYYSYIAHNDNGIFLSKNTIGSPINEFDYSTKTVVNLDQQVTTEQAAVPQVPTVEAQAEETVAAPAEVTEEVTQEEVQAEAPVEVAPEQVTEATQEEALQPAVPVEGVVEQPAEEAVEAPQEEALQPEIPVEGTTEQTEEVASEEAPVETTEQVTQEEVQTETPVEETAEAEEATDEVGSLETDPEEAEEVKEEVPAEEEVEAVEETPEEAVEAPQEEVIDEVEDTDSEELDVANVDVDKEQIEEQMNDDTDTFNIENYVEEEPSHDDVDLDIDLDTDDEIDSKYNYSLEDMDSSYDYTDEESNDQSILPPAVVAMKGLIKKCESQDKYIERLETKYERLGSKYESLETNSKKILNHARTLERDYDQAKEENEGLKDKNHKQSEIINLQKRQIADIKKKQQKAEEDLAQVLQVAYGVLSENGNERGSRQKVA